MMLSGREQAEIAEALRKAFNRDELWALLNVLDQELEDISTSPAFETQVAEVVAKANRFGWISELIEEAARENPTRLEELAKRYRAKTKSTENVGSPDVGQPEGDDQRLRSSGLQEALPPRVDREGQETAPTRLERKGPHAQSEPPADRVQLRRQDLDRIDEAQTTLARYVRGYFASEGLFDACAKTRSKLAEGQDSPALMQPKTFWRDLFAGTDGLLGQADRVEACNFFPNQVGSFRKAVSAVRSLLSALRALAPETDPQKLDDLSQAVETMWAGADKLRRDHKDGSYEMLNSLRELLRGIFLGLDQHEEALKAAAGQTAASARTVVGVARMKHAIGKEEAAKTSPVTPEISSEEAGAQAASAAGNGVDRARS